MDSGLNPPEGAGSRSGFLMTTLPIVSKPPVEYARKIPGRPKDTSNLFIPNPELDG